MRKFLVFSRIRSMLSLDLLSCPLPVGYANSLNPLYHQRRSICRSTTNCPHQRNADNSTHCRKFEKKKSSRTQSNTNTTTLCGTEWQAFWAAWKSPLWCIHFSSKICIGKKNIYSLAEEASTAPSRHRSPHPDTRNSPSPPRPLRQVWNNRRKCNYANLMYSSYMNASPTPAALTFCAK